MATLQPAWRRLLRLRSHHGYTHLGASDEAMTRPLSLPRARARCSHPIPTSRQGEVLVLVFFVYWSLTGLLYVLAWATSHWTGCAVLPIASVLEHGEVG